MPLRHEERSAREAELQRDLERSWDNAQAALNDPDFLARLEASIARANDSSSTTTFSKGEFLAATESLAE